MLFVDFDEELTMVQKVSGWSFVIVSFLLCALFLTVAAKHVVAQVEKPSTFISPQFSQDVSDLKMADQRIEGKIERLTDIVDRLAKQEEANTDKIYDLNTRLVWVYGTGGGAFGLMGFLQFLNVKKAKNGSRS